MTRARLLIALLLVATLGTAGWHGWQLQSRRALVLHHLPPMPELGSQPPVLSESLAEAETLARSWRHAPAGLAEVSRFYHANGFYPEALLCYAGLLKVDPHNARWPHLQACIITNYGRMDEALPLRELAVTLAPNYLPARLRLGDVLLKTNRYAEAAKAYTAALGLAPGDPYALLGLARCDLAAGDWTRAQNRLSEAIAKNPDFIGALSLLVTVSEHLGDSETAEALKTRIGRREFSDLPDPWLDDLADVCFDAYRLSVAAAVANAAGQHDKALELLDRSIALAPGASSYQRQAGQILLNGQDFSRAKQHLEKAVALNPTDSDAWLLLLTALRGLGREQEAVNKLLRGLTHCPQSPSLHLEYARWLKTAGRLDEAIAEFRYGYELRPSDASPLVELAGAYFAVDRNAEAVAALEQALERQPAHPMALATLTFYAISLKDEAEALRRWEQVRRQSKTPPEVVDGLRRAFQQQFGRALP
ncbi:MAG TPA: tetratricopeptide repeat protein [Lacunisphaera sp.]